jgi:paraquat-inducible protein B
VTMGTNFSEEQELPLPKVHNRRWMPRLVWIVPIAAAAVGISLMIKSWQEAGPQITISFLSGEGVQVGKTLVKYRDVTVGRVSAVVLSADHQKVVVTADLSKDATGLVTADTQFWIVRPRIGVGWASGLETLLSGSYIGMQVGSSVVAARRFEGLENPPPLSHGPNGLQVDLHTSVVGSFATGAPVYFRHFRVGRIIEENLRPDGAMRVSLFIEAPYNKLVNPRTRYWNASGVDLTVGTDGLTLRSESIATVLAGGVAFDDGPPDADVGTPVDPSLLYRSEKEAMAPPDGEPRTVRMRFAHALRGLEVGAPVEFVGVNIGAVIAVDLGYEPKDRSFPMIVTAKLFPRRMGQAYQALAAQGTTESEATMAVFVGTLVSRGLRAQPRPVSLLSDKLYVALDFMPAASPVAYNPSVRPLELPTVSGTAQEIEGDIARLVQKVNNLPLQQIAHHLDADLGDLHGTLTGLNQQILPQATQTLSSLHETLQSLNSTLDEGSPLKRSIDDTLFDTRNTLDAIRELTEYLERHPNALLRGRGPARAPIQEAAPQNRVVP